MMGQHSLSRRRNEECALCPGLDGKAGPCDLSNYSRKYVRFMLAHQEAFLAAYVDGNAQASANELERLSREYRTLPPRHVCSCRATHCSECGRRNQLEGCMRHANGYVPGCEMCAFHQQPRVTIGRTTPVHAPMPSVACLDLMAGYAA